MSALIDGRQRPALSILAVDGRERSSSRRQRLGLQIFGRIAFGCAPGRPPSPSWILLGKKVDPPRKIFALQKSAPSSLPLPASATNPDGDKREELLRRASKAQARARAVEGARSKLNDERNAEGRKLKTMESKIEPVVLDVMFAEAEPVIAEFKRLAAAAGEAAWKVVTLKALSIELAHAAEGEVRGELFPHSRVLVSPGELSAAAGVAGWMRGYLPQRWAAGFDPEPLVLGDAPFGPFARSRRLTDDGAVVALPTPGHTPDHLSVAVDEGDTLLLIVGDATYSETNLLRGQVDGVSPNEAVAAATLARLQALTAARPTIVLPTHDPAAASRLAGRQTVTSD